MNRIHQIFISPTFSFNLLFPDGVLAEYVSMMWASEGVPPYSQERIVPDGASVLIFNFGSKVKSGSEIEQKDFKKTLFTGVFSMFSNMDYLPNQSIHNQIGIIFKPAGAYPFIKQPIIEFKNIAIETDYLPSKQFDELHEKLGSEVDISKRLLLLESSLMDILKKNYEKNIIQELINVIKLNPSTSIEEIVKKTGYSQQHLNRLLGKFGGINTKGFQKIFRINNAMKSMLNASNELNLTEIAYQNGYFDQAHFIHDFQVMIGMLPKEYRQIKQPTTSRVIYL